MSDKNIRYETIPNGIKCSYTFKEDVLNAELNEFIGDRIKELNELQISDKNEEYIRLLLNRINQAIEYIENIDEEDFIETEHYVELLEILKGENK